jgi:hypothetical protein
VTFTLPSSGVDVGGILDPGEHLLNVSSGTVTVQTSTAAEFAADFDVQLASSDGLTVSIVGSANATDCHLEERCSY